MNDSEVWLILYQATLQACDGALPAAQEADVALEEFKKRYGETQAENVQSVYVNV